MKSVLVRITSKNKDYAGTQDDILRDTMWRHSRKFFDIEIVEETVAIVNVAEEPES